jgi:hypothetical protein
VLFGPESLRGPAFCSCGGWTWLTSLGGSVKRDVALKILPASFATDADRLARFQREAEVLATLNRPNYIRT